MDAKEIRKVEDYLKKLFGNAHMRVVPRPKKDDSAEIYIGDNFTGVLTLDDEDDDRSYNFEMNIAGKEGSIAKEGRKVEQYLRELLGNPALRVAPRQKKDDSAEIYIGDEFIGVVFVDDDKSYNFQMAILSTDLEPSD